jgi:hypothetical protein
MYLNRTHPFVENLAAYIMNTSLDPILKSVARRCGVIRTNQVQQRTTLLLTRFRYHIITITGKQESPLLAEDCQIMGFAGAPDKAVWLEDEVAEKLFLNGPDANIGQDQAIPFIGKVIGGFEHLWPHLHEEAHNHGKDLLEAHRRVRTASRQRGVTYRVEPHLPPDILGIYVYLPAVG